MLSKIKHSIFLVILLIGVIAFGQDAHFSQFKASPIFLNPSLTGIMHQKEMRVVSQHRNQWSSVNSRYRTTSVAFDMPLDTKVGVGGYIVNQDAAQNFSTLTFVLSAAYDISNPNQHKHHINMGAQLGFINKSSNYGQLIFDSQYDGTNFDADLESGESNTDTRYSKFMPELTFGISYVNTDIKSKYHPYAGFSLAHLTRPNESFLDGKSKLPMRYMFNAGVKFFVEGTHIIDPTLLFMFQRNARILSAGLLYTYIVHGQDTKIGGGLYYRHEDAIIPVLNFDYYNFRIQLSYDINISRLSEFSNRKGAYELTLVYKGLTAKQRRSNNNRKRYL